MWLAGLAWLLAACSGSALLDDAHRAPTIAYEPGVPAFELAVSPTIEGGRTGLDCFVGVPPVVLVFAPEAAAYTARFEILFRLMDERGRTVVEETVRRDTLRLARHDATQSYTAVVFEQRLAVPPGRYRLEVALTDEYSRQQARRRRRVEVLPATGPAALGEVRLSRRDGAEAVPVLARHLAAGAYRASARLYRATHLRATVGMRLLRFPSDTAAAAPPYLFRLDHAYARVRFDRPDTLAFVQRPLAASSPQVVPTFDLPALSEGFYRAEIFVEEAGRPARLASRHDFVIHPPDFPRVTTLDAMIESLVYLARLREMEPLLEATSPAERKRRFDAFWGSLIPERNQAANTLERYYARVEEANRRFTTYKPGWKTDRGMVFILLGQPLYVDWHVDREIWYYSYDDRDEARAFIFQRRRFYEAEGLFETYLLERTPAYQPAWQRALQRWRRGEVL